MLPREHDHHCDPSVWTGQTRSEPADVRLEWDVDALHDYRSERRGGEGEEHG